MNNVLQATKITDDSLRADESLSEDMQIAPSVSTPEPQWKDIDKGGLLVYLCCNPFTLLYPTQLMPMIHYLHQNMPLISLVICFLERWVCGTLSLSLCSIFFHLYLCLGSFYST